ncbi:MAG: hypothetical protein ACE14L_00345 [Terriglobales bacterium]
MRKRLLLSIFLGLAACGVFFYLFVMMALVWTALTGPQNPATNPELQVTLRQVALPISIALGIVVFVAFHRQLRRREARPAANVIAGR